MQTKSAAILIAIAGFAATSSAAPINWWQPVNGLWSDESRWSTQHIPGVDDDVTFATGPAIALIIQPAFARMLTVGASTNVQIAGGTTLSLAWGVWGVGVLHVNTDSAPFDTSLYIGSFNNTDVRLGAVNNALLDHAAVRPNAGSDAVHVNDAFVHGSGNLYSNWANHGTISADVSGHVLQFVGGNHSNSGTMSAVSGTLNFGSGSLNQTGAGTLLADAGGIVNLGNTSVAGGTIKANTSSRVNIGSSAPVSLGCTIDGTGGGLVTFNGPITSLNCTFKIGAAGFELSKGSTLTLVPATLLGGTLTIRGNTVGPATTLVLGNNVNFTGANTLALDAAGAGSEQFAVIQPAVAGIKLDAGQTIRGAGWLLGSSSFANNGLIQADVSNRRLTFHLTLLTNNAVIKAISGGILDFPLASMQQGANGRLIADAGSSLLLSANITGGSVESQNGGSVTVQDGVWSNVTPVGPLTVQTLTYSSPNLTNNSTITIVGRLSTIGSVVGGTGTIFLKNPGVLSGGSSTIGASQVIQGTGTLTGGWINQGTIKPANADAFFVGTIGVDNKLTLAPSSRIEIETDTFAVDVIGTAGKGQIALDGNVLFRISLWNFNQTSTSMDFIKGQSITGKFKTFSLSSNPAPAGRAWRIYYQPTKTSLRVTCSADQDGDFLVDDTDFSYFVASYDLLDCADSAMPQTCPADLNKDGLVDDADFTLFVVAYNNLLCF